MGTNIEPDGDEDRKMKGAGESRRARAGETRASHCSFFLWSCGLGYFDTNALFFMSYFHSVYICEPVMAGGLGLMSK
jgi:hypothetical protein